MRHGVIGVVAFALAVGGCTFGPAANRAGQVGAGAEDPEAGETWSESPSQVSPNAPDPESAPAHGSAEVVDELALDGVGDPCCVAELPSGDLLVGARDSGMVYRLSRATGTVTEVGVVWEVTLGQEEGEDGEDGEDGEGDSELLGLAVEPGERETGWVYASYIRSSGGVTVARHSYDDGAPEGEQLGTYPQTFAEGLAVSDTETATAAPLAFGPDGVLYAGTSDGTVLRVDPSSGLVPEVSVYSFGHGSVRGLAFDAAGRLWVADAGGAVVAVVPGEGTLPLWDAPAGEAVTVAGLAYGEGSLWLLAAGDGGDGGNGDDGGGVWRIPLDGATGLVADPELVRSVTGGRGVAAVAASEAGPSEAGGSGLWVLTNDAALRLRIE